MKKIIVMKWKYLILAVIFYVLLAIPLSSKSQTQDIEDQTQGKSEQVAAISVNQKIQETLESLREIGLIKELGISGDRAQKIIETIRLARKIRQRYLLQRYQIESTLYALLGVPTPDETKLNEILKELESAKLQYYQDMIQTDNELQHILSPEEQAKYILFQRNFNQKLKEIIARIRQQSAATSSNQNFLLRKQEQESVIRQPH